MDFPASDNPPEMKAAKLADLDDVATVLVLDRTKGRIARWLHLPRTHAPPAHSIL